MLSVFTDSGSPGCPGQCQYPSRYKPMDQSTDSRWMMTLACLLGATAVMTGAFGAHALRDILTDQSRGWYDTAVTYHARHALALFGCALLSLHVNSGTMRRWVRTAGICFTLGTLIFSGTLYAMTFTHMTKLGMITPIGGLLLIIAWLSLAMAAFRLTSSPTA